MPTLVQLRGDLVDGGLNQSTCIGVRGKEVSPFCRCYCSDDGTGVAAPALLESSMEVDGAVPKVGCQDSISLCRVRKWV